MASAVYSESPASRLSLSLEGTASASPFPSPSSSFLPPPTPGAHEFAMKPVPSARNGRKASSAHISTPRGDLTEIKPQRSSLNALQEASAPRTNWVSTDGSVPSSPFPMSPTTPTPSTLKHQPASSQLEPPRSPAPFQSTSTSTTPTIPTSSLPPETDANELSTLVIPDTLAAALADVPPSPAFSTSSRPISSSIDPSLFSNRPAPPSPAMSRRVSGAPSAASARSRSSRPPSAAVSRANSLRKSTSMSTRGSPVINPHRQSIGNRLSQSFAPLPSPQNVTFSLTTPQPSASTSASPAASAPASAMGLSPSSAMPVVQKRVSAVVHIKIRDFAFPPADERHVGLGPDVPKPNRVVRLNRRLGGRTLSTGSVESSDCDDEEEEEEEEEEDDGWGNSMGGGGGWDGFRMGLGRFSWNGGAAGGSTAATVLANSVTGNENGSADGGAFPSRIDLDRNFLDNDDSADHDEDEDEFYDVGTGDDDEDTLYPGLYRALYAFEPEGTAEMRLVEDQIVRVVGRGGGVGWAVVIDERDPVEEGGVKNVPFAATNHALVPESYLEPVKLDWELDDHPIDASDV